MLLVQCVNDETLGFLTGWYFVDDSFFWNRRAWKFRLVGCVLSRLQFMKAQRPELEDLFGDFVWSVHKAPEPEKERVLKARNSGC